MRKTWLAVSCVVVLASACGSKKDKDAGGGGKAPTQWAGGCDRREKESICAEYGGTATTDFIRSQCDAMKVPYVKRCPKDGAVGRCVQDAGTQTETHTVFYGPKLTMDTAKAMCAAPAELREP